MSMDAPNTNPILKLTADKQYAGEQHAGEQLQKEHKAALEADRSQPNQLSDKQTNKFYAWAVFNHVQQRAQKRLEELGLAKELENKEMAISKTNTFNNTVLNAISKDNPEALKVACADQVVFLLGLAGLNQQQLGHTIWEQLENKT